MMDKSLMDVKGGMGSVAIMNVTPDGLGRKRPHSQPFHDSPSKRQLSKREKSETREAMPRWAPPLSAASSESGAIKTADQSNEIKQENVVLASHKTPLVDQIRSDAFCGVPETKGAAERESKGVDKAQHLQALLSARNTRAARIEAVLSRIQAGERGLGSLTRQLYETQLAIQRRELEISRLTTLYQDEETRQQDCEAAIRQLRNS